MVVIFCTILYTYSIFQHMGCLNLSADAVGALDDLRRLEVETLGDALFIPVSSKWHRLSRWWAPEEKPPRPGYRQNHMMMPGEPNCGSSPCRWSHHTWRTDLMEENTEYSALLLKWAHGWSHITWQENMINAIHSHHYATFHTTSTPTTGYTLVQVMCLIMNILFKVSVDWLHS